MSKVAIEGNISGSGTLTIAAPNTNSNFTLDIPAASGTLDRLNRAGNVLQVVQASTSTQVLISTSTYTDTGLSASITPTNSSSKILVIVSQSMQTQVTANTDAITAFRIVRDSTAVATYNRIQGVRAGTGSSSFVINIGYVSPIYLDSPSTTSSVTYKTQFSMTSGNASIANTSDTLSTITLMEIAA